MNTLKHNNALRAYTGFRGPQTLKAIEAQIPAELAERLTGAEYGQVMTAVDQAFKAGAASVGAALLEDGRAIWVSKSPDAPHGMLVSLDDGKVTICRYSEQGDRTETHYTKVTT